MTLGLTVAVDTTTTNKGRKFNLDLFPDHLETVGAGCMPTMASSKQASFLSTLSPMACVSKFCLRRRQNYARP